MKTAKRIVVWGALAVMVVVLLVSCPANSLLTSVQEKVNAYQVSQNQAEITAFSFVGFTNYVGGINQNGGTIAVSLPYTSVTALVAAFTTSASSVKVGGVSQFSGVTANNFTNPVVYTTVGQNGSTKNYTVTVTIAAPTPGEAWTARTLPNNEGWTSVTFGNGVFLAVAWNGIAATSSNNGTSWAAQTLPTSSANWGPVTYGNNTFVAVPSVSTAPIATSSNGSSWASGGTLPSCGSGNWASVTYGDGVFVAVANSSNVTAISSTNGSSWTPGGNLPSFGYWSSVTYGNGVFVAVSVNGNATAIGTYSDGTLTWTLGGALPSPPPGWTSATYGDGVFVAVASSSNVTAISSTNGSSWTPGGNLPSSTTWGSVTYGNGYFVAVADGSAQAATSPDGIHWTAASLPSSAFSYWLSVTFGNGTFVAVSNASNTAATSP